MLLAQAYRRMGSLEVASQMIQLALQKESGRADIYREQGEILEKQGQLSEALASYEEIPDIKSKSGRPCTGTNQTTNIRRRGFNDSYSHMIGLFPSPIGCLRALPKVTVGGLIGLTAAHIGDTLFQYTTLTFGLIVAILTISFLWLSRRWHLLGLLVFSLAIKLTALLVRMYIEYAASPPL